MAAPVGPFPPTSQVVAVALLKLVVPELHGNIGTTLPRDAATWRDDGFLTVRAIPQGRTDVDVPARRRPVLTLDGWANAGDSKKTPWHKANRVLELVRIATEADLYGVAPILPTMPDNYLAARVQAFYLITEPTQVEDDPAGYARFTADLEVDWLIEPAAA